jgi:hypothetical protein
MRLPSLPRRALLSAAAYTAQRTLQKSQWKFGLGAEFLVFDDHDELATRQAQSTPIPYLVRRGTFLLAGARVADSLAVKRDSCQSAGVGVARLSDPPDRLDESKD